MPRIKKTLARSTDEKPKAQPLQHTYDKHEDCEREFCHVCQGGLLFCTTCKGAEASLTTHCIGRPLTEREEERIVNQGRDFKDGRWIQRATIKKDNRP